MSELAHKIKVIFYVTGSELNPKEFAEEIGIENFEIGIKGEPRQNGRSRNIESYWQISLEMESYSVDDSLLKLFNYLESALCVDSMLKILDKHKVEVSFICNVTIREERPLYQLERQTVKKISNLGGEFLMDIFDYS